MAKKLIKFSVLILIIGAALLPTYFIDTPILSSGIAHADWPLQNITNNINDQVEPEIATDSAGRAHAVWTDDREGNAEIFYKRSDDGGATWNETTLRKIRSDGLGGGAWNPEITVDNLGYLHVVWEDSRSSDLYKQIFYKRSEDGGATWIAEKQRSPASAFTNYKYPAIASYAGNIHIAWRSSYAKDGIFLSQIRYDVSHDNGQTWVFPFSALIGQAGGTTDDHTTLFAPSLSVYAENVHIAWGQGKTSDWSLYYRRDWSNGIFWPAPARSIFDAGYLPHPSVTASSANDVHIVFENWPTDLLYMESNDNGNAFSSPSNLTNINKYCLGQKIITDNSGNLHMVFLSRVLTPTPSFDYELYYTYSTNRGADWSGDMITSASGSNATLSPALAFDNSGNVHVAWHDNRDGNWEIYYAKNSIFPTSSISGDVSGYTGPVTVYLSGSSIGSQIVYPPDSYSFTGLSAGTYNVTIEEITDYTVSPESYTGIILATGTDVTEKDFVYTQVPVAGNKISGFISGDLPSLAGVTITLSGPSSGTTTTLPSGYYEFSGLSNGSYTIFPENISGYSVLPASHGAMIFDNDDTDNDFSYTADNNIYSIWGYVSGVSPLSGRTIYLSGDSSATATTGGTGYYEFENLPPNGTYEVTAETIAGYTVNPSEHNVTMIGGNGGQNKNFAYTSSGPSTYSISGTISGPSPLNGITITLTFISDGSTITTLTTSTGSFEFTGLSNGQYWVTPENIPGYWVSPARRFVTILNDNNTDNDFSYSSDIYSIWGYVSGVSPLSGRTIYLSGDSSETATTGGTGYYEFENLPPNGTYEVTAETIAGYTVNPSEHNVTMIGGNGGQNKNFAYISSGPSTYDISGNVTDNFGTPIQGRAITLSGYSSDTITTDINGDYVFEDLTDGETYYITPETVPGYSVNPAQHQVTLSSSHAPGNNFFYVPTAPSTYDISGVVTDNFGTPIQGRTITLSGYSSDSTTTDINGIFVFADLTDGETYFITPETVAGYSVNPALHQVDLNLSDSPGNNFVYTAIPPSTYSIYGNIIGYIGQVDIYLSGDDFSSQIIYAPNIYSFSNLAPGFYTITIEAITGYTVIPENYTSIEVIDADILGIDFAYSQEATIDDPPITGVINYPNPFNPEIGEQTRFEFYIAEPTRVGIYIFDAGGRLIWKQEEVLIDGQVIWDGYDMLNKIAGNGVYLTSVVNLDKNKFIGRCKPFIAK